MGNIPIGVSGSQHGPDKPTLIRCVWRLFIVNYIVYKILHLCGVGRRKSPDIDIGCPVHNLVRAFVLPIAMVIVCIPSPLQVAVVVICWHRVRITRVPGPLDISRRDGIRIACQQDPFCSIVKGIVYESPNSLRQIIARISAVYPGCVINLYRHTPFCLPIR